MTPGEQMGVVLAQRRLAFLKNLRVFSHANIKDKHARTWEALDTWDTILGFAYNTKHTEKKKESLYNQMSDCVYLTWGN